MSPKRDFSQIAFDIVQQVTGAKADTPAESPKVTRARKGGLKGGKARAKSLSKEERAEIAKIAAAARWKKSNS